VRLNIERENEGFQRQQRLTFPFPFVHHQPRALSGELNRGNENYSVTKREFTEDKLGGTNERRVPRLESYTKGIPIMTKRLVPRSLRTTQRIMLLSSSGTGHRNIIVNHGRDMDEGYRIED